MNINEFVKGYEITKDKDAFVEKHIVKKYVPFVEKVGKCKSIVDTTSHKVESNGFELNTPARYLIFTMSLIEMYTDIEFDTNDMSGNYDVLNKVGALAKLKEHIPTSEHAEMTFILNMCVDDLMEKERSLAGSIDKFISMFNGFAPALEEFMKNTDLFGEQNG